jgi:hypothetical protein
MWATRQPTHDDAMITSTPQAAAAATRNMELPSGDDERVIGFGVMGLPFASGHYLAYRDFPATSFSPAYKSVWHRDPDGVWTFYATTRGQQSCSRFLSSATPVDPVVCDIAATWVTPWSLLISVDGLLDWRVDIKTTKATRVLSAIAGRIPAAAWTSRNLLTAMSRIIGPALRIGAIRLFGNLPNGQEFRIAPVRVWAVDDATAVLQGDDLGPVGPLSEQGRLADFHLPQRGICVVTQGRFEPFDTARHRDSERLGISR